MTTTLTVKTENSQLYLWKESERIELEASSLSLSAFGRLAVKTEAIKYDDVRVVYERPCGFNRTSPVTMFVKKLDYGYVAGAWAA